MSNVDRILEGTLDIHVHFGPDPKVERRAGAVEVAEGAASVHPPKFDERQFNLVAHAKAFAVMASSMRRTHSSVHVSVKTKAVVEDKSIICEQEGQHLSTQRAELNSRRSDSQSPTRFVLPKNV